MPPEDAPTTSAGDGLQYDSDGDLIIPQEPAASGGGANRNTTATAISSFPKSLPGSKSCSTIATVT